MAVWYAPSQVAASHQKRHGDSFKYALLWRPQLEANVHSSCYSLHDALTTLHVIAVIAVTAAYLKEPNEDPHTYMVPFKSSQYDRRISSHSL